MLASWRWGVVLVGLAVYIESALAIGQSTCVEFKSSPSTFPIVSGGKGTPIFLSADEWPGVQRAAFDFAADIQRVTGVMPSMKNITSMPSPKTSQAIIIGTLGKSSLIDAVVNNTKLDVSSINGKWESFIAKEVKNPLPGVSSAYVMIGSDKRGTIFNLYDHSEQFGEHRRLSALSHCLLTLLCVGVSPWYW